MKCGETTPQGLSTLPELLFILCSFFLFILLKGQCSKICLFDSHTEKYADGGIIYEKLRHSVDVIGILR
jgi:hypothetical protein